MICSPRACSYASWKLDVAKRFDDRTLASRLVADNDEFWKRLQGSADVELLEFLDALNQAVRMSSKRLESIMVVVTMLTAVCHGGL
jgi:hypothetical protein